MENLIKDIFECRKCNFSERQGTDREYYGGDGKRKIMLVFQNPGVPTKMLYKGNETIEEKIEICRKGFHNYWVLGRQKDTFERFFKIFNKYGLINMDKDYIKNRNYFTDLYITDFVKCHSKTNEIKGEQPCSVHLREEIKSKEPNLIIAFSDRTISFFKQFDIRPVGHNEELRPQAAKLHGRLYKCDDLLDFYLMPSIHIAVNYFSPRDSYFKYFEEGIKKYSKIAK